MELSQLEYFIKLAEYENFTTASKELHITQPALSIAINKLENDFGTKLFDRGKSKISLNKYGQILLPHAIKIFDELDAAINAISDSADQINISYVFMHPMNELLTDYLAKNPNAVIHQHDITSYKDLEQKIISSEIDFAICYSPTDTMHESLVFEKLCDDPQFIFLSVHNPLSRFDSLKYSDLKNSRFIKNVFFKESNSLNVQGCIDAGFVPNFVFEGSRREILDGLILQDYGITFIGEGGAKLRKSRYPDWEKHYRFIPIDNDQAQRSIGLISRGPSSLPVEARKLYKYIFDNYIPYRDNP